MACGTDKIIADESIGHKTPNKFRKHSKQNIETMKKEYSKASSTINIFSRLYHMINKIDSKN